MCPIAFYHHAKKSKLFWWAVSEKMPKKQNIWHLLPLTLKLRFFSKFQSCQFFYFINPQLRAKFQKKNNEQFLSYLKTDTQTDGPHGWLLRIPSGKPGSRGKNSFWNLKTPTKWTICSRSKSLWASFTFTKDKNLENKISVIY